MIGDKIHYTCKNCGWKTSIRQEWADLKPKRCLNKKCNMSFLKTPDNLLIQLPTSESVTMPKEEPKKQSKKSPKLNLE